MDNFFDRLEKHIQDFNIKWSTNYSITDLPPPIFVKFIRSYIGPNETYYTVTTHSTETGKARLAIYRTEEEANARLRSRILQVGEC